MGGWARILRERERGRLGQWTQHFSPSNEAPILPLCVQAEPTGENEARNGAQFLCRGVGNPSLADGNDARKHCGQMANSKDGDEYYTARADKFQSRVRLYDSWKESQGVPTESVQLSGDWCQKRLNDEVKRFSFLSSRHTMLGSKQYSKEMGFHITKKRRRKRERERYEGPHPSQKKSKSTE